MIEFFLSIIYFFRPISYINLGISYLSLSVLEWFAIFSLIILFFIAFFNFFTGKVRPFTTVDFLIFLFTLWVLVGYFAYFDRSQTSDVGKFIVPFITYFIVRNSVDNSQSYLRLLWFMIIGFSIPTFISAFLIFVHKGMYVQDYWTKLYRFTGSYPNPHDLGHNMTFLLMIISIYLTLYFEHNKGTKRFPSWKKVFIAFLVPAALFCLYKSYVRTSYLGLFVFILTFLYFYNRKILITFVSLLAIIILASFSIWSLIFHDVVDVAKGKRETERIASGRPYIWRHNIEEFNKLTIDRKLAGVGPGNRIQVLSKASLKDNFWNSHNDYLEVIIQTGIIGFIFFFLIQILIFRTIFFIPSRVRFAYIALFLSVTFMNFASNSYVTRFGLGQSFYLVIIYADLFRPSRIDLLKRNL